MYRCLNKRNIDEDLSKYTKILAFATIILAIATVLLVFETLKLSDSNERLTKISEEFYKYHPPDVGLTPGYISEIYVLRNSSYGTLISVLGVYTIYNSAISDDAALIKKTNLRESSIPPDIPNKTISGYTTIEGNSFPIPIIPGDPPKQLPLLVTRQIGIIIEDNSTIYLEIQENISKIEIIHPVNMTILSNLTALEPCNVTYKMGQNEAIVMMNDGSKYSIKVDYSEDYEQYKYWKSKFLNQFGTGYFII